MSIPLSPPTGGRTISPSSLRVADIIVSTTNSVVSRTIRAGSFSEVSHAMLYVGGNHIVEAVSPRVRFVSTRLALRDASLAVAYRHNNMTFEKALQVRDFVGNQIGRRFFTGGAAAAGATNLQSGIGCAAVEFLFGRSRFYCSELVFAAYEHAGLSLLNERAIRERIMVPSHPACTVPGSLLNVRSLRYVGHLVTEVSQV